jgi:hypothetical protein
MSLCAISRFNSDSNQDKRLSQIQEIGVMLVGNGDVLNVHKFCTGNVQEGESEQKNAI